jgi:hypothetical protein
LSRRRPAASSLLFAKPTLPSMHCIAQEAISGSRRQASAPVPAAQLIAIGQPAEPVAPLIGMGVNM